MSANVFVGSPWAVATILGRWPSTRTRVWLSIALSVRSATKIAPNPAATRAQFGQDSGEKALCQAPSVFMSELLSFTAPVGWLGRVVTTGGTGGLGGVCLLSCRCSWGFLSCLGIGSWAASAKSAAMNNAFTREYRNTHGRSGFGAC